MKFKLAKPINLNRACQLSERWLKQEYLGYAMFESHIYMITYGCGVLAFSKAMKRCEEWFKAEKVQVVSYGTGAKVPFKYVVEAMEKYYAKNLAEKPPVLVWYEAMEWDGIARLDKWDSVYPGLKLALCSLVQVIAEPGKKQKVLPYAPRLFWCALVDKNALSSEYERHALLALLNGKGICREAMRTKIVQGGEGVFEDALVPVVISERLALPNIHAISVQEDSLTKQALNELRADALSLWEEAKSVYKQVLSELGEVDESAELELKLAEALQGIEGLKLRNGEYATTANLLALAELDYSHRSKLVRKVMLKLGYAVQKKKLDGKTYAIWQGQG
jgi:hypothetical protein